MFPLKLWFLFILLTSFSLIIGTFSYPTDNLIPPASINEKANAKDPKIIIIGAGASGIAAATKLMQHGFNNITLLEAENRIGGRVNTVDFGEYKVDLGGQWVHGEDGNAAYDLAAPLGLLDKLDYSKTKAILYNESGGLLSDEITNKLSSFFNIHGAEELEEEDGLNYTSRGDYIKTKFKEHYANESFYKDSDKYLRTLEMLVIGNWAADSWDELPVDDLEYHRYPGDDAVNWKTRGYSTILDIMMKNYPNPEEELPVMNKTILNTEVENICWACGENNLVKISTKPGVTYEADHVIVTVSLGVLKNNFDTLFTPALPEIKIQNIQKIKFGTIAKVILLFDKPFWPTDDLQWLGMGHFWEEADVTALTNTEKEWTLGTTGFETIENKPDLLLMWVNGKHSRMMEALPEEKVFNHTVELLYQFLGKNFNVTDPIAMIRTQWYSNPHFKGTYTYRSLETIEQNGLPKYLEEPLNPENLTVLFAGEATSPHRFSTVDGAIGSGWNAADRLINHYKNIKTSAEVISR